ncbi:MAG: fatty acid desaturase [Planctomycetales bacterium]|nr:fatty acid desaturase [Planctomycetales bacterium]
MEISSEAMPAQTGAGLPEWSKTIGKYNHADVRKSVWQIVNTFVPFVALSCLMYVSLSWSYWLSLLLAPLTAGFLVRIFIIQHDCGHNSFFRSRRANTALGVFCSVLTVTPYHLWRRCHALHHTTNGNLSHRGIGDILTLTVDEYLELSRWGRLRYRLYRNPIVMFFFGASYMFIIRQRFAYGTPHSWRRERWGVYATNVGIGLVLLAAWWTIGLGTFFMLWLPVAMLGAAAGTWLFFVQHQFEQAYWQPEHEWDFTRAALEGSSYYRLPRVLQWFTGNIGFHHIHHLNSRIPNYHLHACYKAEPAFRDGVTIGLWESLGCAAVKLWDVRQQRMIGFAEAKAKYAA